MQYIQSAYRLKLQENKVIFNNHNYKANALNPTPEASTTIYAFLRTTF